MSAISYPDCFSDLLCCEDSGVFTGESPECSSDFESVEVLEDSIDELIEDERNFVPGLDYLSMFQSEQILDASAREKSVLWMLKVQGYHGFQPLTAYLAVNYMDRFLYSRQLPTGNGWPLQLLSVTCLSLAAKMEELLVPPLLNLQVENAKFMFEPRTIQRMELLVLNALNWRLRSITPFNFLAFFAYKIDQHGSYMALLISRATEIILSNIQDTIFLEYWPSCIAAAAILCAANEIPFISVDDPKIVGSWCEGLNKDTILRCYRSMQNVIINNRIETPSKVFPRLRVTTRASLRFSIDSSSSSSCSASSPYKRRKLSNSSWVDDDDKGNSE